MGQSECLNILEKRNQWILSTELSRCLSQEDYFLKSMI